MIISFHCNLLKKTSSANVLSFTANLKIIDLRLVTLFLRYLYKAMLSYCPILQIFKVISLIYLKWSPSHFSFNANFSFDSYTALLLHSKSFPILILGLAILLHTRKIYALFRTHRLLHFSTNAKQFSTLRIMAGVQFLLIVNI